MPSGTLPYAATQINSGENGTEANATENLLFTVRRWPDCQSSVPPVSAHLREYGIQPEK